MDLGLDDSAVLVTGVSSGLGKASAESLAREGANVAICARNATDLEAARADIDADASGDVLAVQGDVTDDQGDIEAIVGETVETLGGLDHLVVSTGGPRTAAFLETNERDWYLSYDLLVMSVVRLAKVAHPHLVESGAGSVVVVGSTTAREVEERFVLSVTHRHALVGLVGILARELAPEVRANAVLPGPHDTPYLTALLEEEVERGRYPSIEAAREDWRSEIPLGAVGDPGAFGDAVAFLASERAPYVTGTALPVDGGKLRG